MKGNVKASLCLISDCEYLFYVGTIKHIIKAYKSKRLSENRFYNKCWGQQKPGYAEDILGISGFDLFIRRLLLCIAQIGCDLLQYGYGG